MKKLLTIIILIGFLLFTSCNSSGTYLADQTEIAYSYIHGGYVGRAVIEVDSDGMLKVDVDEAFLPHTLALVDIKGDKWNDMNTVMYKSHSRDYYAAKYVEYDGKKYTAVTAGSSISYVEADEMGMPIGDKDLEKIIITGQATMAAYYSFIPAGKFKIFTEFGGKGIAVTTTSYGGFTKKASPEYWNFGQTWKGNINALEVFVNENGVKYSLSEMNRDKNEDSKGLKKWSVADTVTGATNADFRNYFALIQAAAGRLKTN